MAVKLSRIFTKNCDVFLLSTAEFSAVKGLIAWPFAI
jgi:hypothetical protein